MGTREIFSSTAWSLHPHTWNELGASTSLSSEVKKERTEAEKNSCQQRKTRHPRAKLQPKKTHKRPNTQFVVNTARLSWRRKTHFPHLVNKMQKQLNEEDEPSQNVHIFHGFLTRNAREFVLIKCAIRSSGTDSLAESYCKPMRKIFSCIFI